MAHHQKLGDFSLQLFRFPRLCHRMDSVQEEGFWQKTERKRIEQVHAFLLKLIQETPTPCFLLAAVNEFIEQVNERKWLHAYSLAKFELWLNLFSGLSFQENYEVRAKIMGKFVPREAYQRMFPIGMGKVYPGSHYVTAHGSPDLDTTVASFLGWVDAFAARVSLGLHIWNVPGGPPESQVEVQFLFPRLLGPHCFDSFAKTRTSLALSAVDLVSRDGIVQKTARDSAFFLEDSARQKAVILVDDEGNYLGDWRHVDVESVRKVSSLLNNCMRWFAGYFQRRMTLLLARESVTKEAFCQCIQEMFSLPLCEADPVKEFTEKQKRLVEDCLSKVFEVSQGLSGSFRQFWDAMKKLSLHEFEEFYVTLTASSLFSSLFTEKGGLVEHRPEIFCYLEKVFTALEKAVQRLRLYVDQLGIALTIRKKVLDSPAQLVNSRTEVEEIRTKMGSFPYLTVTSSDEQGVLFPVGIIQAQEIFKPILGTVSLRDFCNREETKIPSYFEVISVVDHHKSVLNTSAASTVRIADAQSANALVAELAFEINDEYSLSGRSLEQIEGEIQSLIKSSSLTSKECRVLQRLLLKASERKKTHAAAYFVHPHREYLEYLQCLYAILDDTDLLSKVSSRDVLCVASLLNRMKTLMEGREVEVICFDDLPQDESFVVKAAQRILQQEEMYSLYQKIYEAKELSIEANLRLCMEGKPSSIFSDTKVQNGCCRVGQTKLFAKNFPFYLSRAGDVRAAWYQGAKAFYADRSDCDLHMHMMSTVPGADDVYAGHVGKYPHQDELWIWIPMQEQAIEHLEMFLSSFSRTPQVMQNQMEVEFLGDNAQEFDQIFAEAFPSVTRKAMKEDSLPIAILRYKAGFLNSRKAMISPYLPKLIG